MAAGTIVKPCDCVNVQQDKIHGSGKRVHNLMGGKNQQTKTKAYRCTSCGKVS